VSGNERREYFVILVRHASREVHWDKPESEHRMENWTSFWPKANSDFDSKGYLRTHAIAGRLCDELDNLCDLGNGSIEIKEILHSKHTIAMQTAQVFAKVLKSRARSNARLRMDELRCCPCSALTPGTNEYRNDRSVDAKLNRACRKLTNPPAGNADSRIGAAYVVVGHQPQLTEIARKLLRKRIVESRLDDEVDHELLKKIKERFVGDSLPGDSLPLGSSEVACIQLGKESRLLWLLTEKTKELLPELKEKIKSKYDVAKFFLGAFAVNTGLLLNAGLWGNPKYWANAHPSARLLAYAAIIAALISLAFTAATLHSYDGLMMPERFWSESEEFGGKPQGPISRFWSRVKKWPWVRSLIDESPQGSVRRPPKWSVRRPPSQAVVVLFYEMMHIWKVFFLPAVGFAFAAIGLFVVALAVRDGSFASFFSWWERLFTFLAIAILAFLIPASFYQEKRPRLGSED
jgi:hypothetical protein